MRRRDTFTSVELPQTRMTARCTHNLKKVRHTETYTNHTAFHAKSEVASPTMPPAAQLTIPIPLARQRMIQLTPWCTVEQFNVLLRTPTEDDRNLQKERTPAAKAN